MNEEEIRYLVRDELRKILDKGLMYSAEAKPQPKKNMSAVDIANEFPENLRKHLTVTVDTIKTEFVSKEMWSQMDGIARKLGFKYVSDGKNSRWKR